MTVRGCHREAEQGYVEVRDRTASYDKVCATLDRTGTVGPGQPVDWLGEDVTACAVEPTADVGQTKVVVRRSGGEVTAGDHRRALPARLRRRFARPSRAGGLGS